jgi:hypothetical protein
MSLFKVAAAFKPTAELETFVGEQGELFYSEADPRLRISDGVTPGGIVVSSDAVDVDLSSVAQSILPAEDVIYDLGSADKQWRDLYLSGTTLFIGGIAAIQKDEDTGNIILPEGAKIQKRDGTKQDIDPSLVTKEDLDLSLFLQDLLNIDITNLQNGSLLQYNSTSTNWEATNDIRNVTINGGAF